MQQGILIVAECNVNEIFFPFDKSMLCILIVAECNVNQVDPTSEKRRI